LKECILEGIEEELDNTEILDDTQIENWSNMNIGGLDTDDQFTINSEAPFSPVPPAALDGNKFVEEQRATGAAFPYVTKQICNMQPFPFYHPFTAEEFLNDKAVFYLKLSKCPMSHCR